MKPQSGQTWRSRLSPSGMRVTVGPRAVGGLDIPVNVAKSLAPRKARVLMVRDGATRRALVPDLRPRRRDWRRGRRYDRHGDVGAYRRDQAHSDRFGSP